MDPESSRLTGQVPTTSSIPKSRGGLIAALRDTTFRSLRGRNYRLYFFGQIISFTGSWMQSAALMWLVFDRTNDPFWPPLMLVAQVGPTVLLGTLGGAIADRLPKKKVVFASQCGFLCTSMMLAILVAANFVSPWILLSMNVINGVIQAVDLPARLSFVPDLVSQEDLINAVSLNSLLFNSARAVGPALAGILFLLADEVAGFFPRIRPVSFGAVCCFTLNSLSYLAVLAALRRIDIGDTMKPNSGHGSFWDGFTYVWQRKTLAILIALTGGLCVFGWPALTLFPAYTKMVLGHAEKEYSLLVSSLGGGALIAALTMATFGSSGRRGFFLSIGGFATTVGLIGLAMSTSITSAMGSAAVGGFGLILFLSTSQSTLQQSASSESRGRVMALWAMMLSASAPLGHLVAGLAAQHYPIPDVLLAMAAGAAVCAITATTISIMYGWEVVHREPG